MTAGERGPEAGSRRARILVIDDEPLVLRALRRTLGREHDVVCEESARAALALVAGGEPFDLVLCDLMMPDLSGFALHAALCASRPDLAARTVFLSGGAFTAAARASLARVAKPCLEKPFEPDALCARVRDLLAALAGPPAGEPSPTHQPGRPTNTRVS